MKVLTVTHPDIENGLGCRVTLWVAGCTHKCPGCHNPHTWNYNQGKDITDESVWRTVYECSNHDYIAGLTLSGGDPLDQNDESLQKLAQFIIRYKTEFPTKNIWIYSGDTFEHLTSTDNTPENINWRTVILSLCDVLIDGPFKQDKYKPNLAFRGSTNQRIIDLKETLLSGNLREPKLLQISE